MAVPLASMVSAGSSLCSDVTGASVGAGEEVARDSPSALIPTVSAILETALDLVTDRAAPLMDSQAACLRSVIVGSGADWDGVGEGATDSVWLASTRAGLQRKMRTALRIDFRRFIYVFGRINLPVS